MGQRELDMLVDEMLVFEQQKDQARKSLNFGMRQNPDEYANNAKLGKTIGATPEFAAQNKKELELRQRMQALPLDDLVRESPKTAQYLSKPDNAAVSQDDIGLFGAMENTLRSVPAGLQQGWDKQKQMFLNYKEVLGTISSSERAELARLEKLAQKRGSEYKEGLPSWFKAASDVVGMSAYSVLDALKYEGALGMGTGMATGAALGLIGGPTAPITSAAGGATGGVIGLKAGTTTGVITNTYESSVGEVYDDLKRFEMPDGTKLDPVVARYAALVAGVPNTALETFSLGKALKLVPGADKVIGMYSTQQIKQILVRPTMRAALKDIGKKYAVAVGTETFTEGLQKFISILGREAAIGITGAPDTRDAGTTIKQDAEDILAEMTEAFKATVVLGGLGGGVKVYSARNEVKKAEQSQAVFEALGETAKESKTLKRMPEKFREFVETATQDGPVQNVYIDAQRFSTYFQSQNINPAAAAQEAGVINFEEAVATGTDLVVPLPQFAERIAPTEHLAGLSSDLRLRQGDMSLRDAQLYQQEQEAQDAEIIAQAEASAGEMQTPVTQQIRDDLLGQLIAAGNERTTAEAYATQYAKVINSLATRNGIDPLALHEQYSLGVTRPLPDVLTQNTRADIAFDPMLDTLRSGQEITDEQVFGPSLVEFVRSQGGILPSGELLDADMNNRPFQRNLVQAEGLSADQVGERAVQAGYFFGRDIGSITEADIFDALDEELRGGTPAYSAANYNEQLLNQRETLNQLADYLDALGIDVSVITDNAQVRQLIQQATQGTELGDQINELFQSVSTRIPTARPRDPNVVVENPLVDRLQIGLESFNSVPDALAKATALLVQYPNWRPNARLKTPEVIAERFISDVQANLLWLYDQVPANIRERSKRWYDGANVIANRMADRYGLSTAQVSAVLAVNSPQTEWFTNVSRAERILDIYFNQQDFAWSAEMESVAGQIYAKDQYQDDLAAIRGKTLRDLDGNETLQAMWIRAHDQAHNDRAFRIVTPEGAFGEYVTNADGSNSRMAWAALEYTAKSIRVIKDGGLQTISAELGNEHKVRSFYNNIFYPEDPAGDVTIDTHAVAAGLLRPLSGSDTEVNHNLGAGVSNALKGISGTYGIYAEAYRRAAAERGVLPREMQSITWEAIRGLYTDTFKRSDAAAGIDTLWQRYNSGRMTQNAVRATIGENIGGLNATWNQPNWYQSDSAAPSQSWSSSYGGELAGFQFPGRSTQSDPNGDFAAGRDGGGADQGVAGTNTLYQSVGAPDTPEFAAWFGDSKVVDKNGQPLVVYHGSIERGVEVFDTARVTDRAPKGDLPGTYFTNDKQYASGYTRKQGASIRDPRGEIVEAYIRITNPLNTTAAIKKYKKQGMSFGDAKRKALEALTPENDGVIFDGDKINPAEYIVFSPEQIKSVTNERPTNDPNILRQGDPLSDKRGFIQFGPNRKFNIALLEKANLSTFLHETGHFYLEVMGDLAERPDAPQQVKDDYAKILKYLGLTSRAELTLDGKKVGSAEYQKAVDAHERFARSNEAYLMEGKAPSEELRSLFQKFKSWLTFIYKTFESLDVKLTNEIREVFDRIYATDAEIAAASEQVITVDMFTTAADMGVTEAEFAAYREAVAQTVESGKEALLAKLMKQAQREREAWWKERKAEMRKEVELETELTPVYAAFKTLTDGKLEDGTPIRLNKEALVERYGEEYLKRLPRSFGRIYTRQGGMDPESAAEFLGFESGDALIEALAGMKPRKEYIEAEVDVRMREVYGDMMTDGTIADEAIAALHNSQRENVLMVELKALRRKQREVAPFVRVERQRQADERRQARAAIETPPAAAFRAAAQGLVGQTSLRDLDPYKHLQASRKAARESSRALVSGDFQMAADAKQRELLNHYMYLESTKAREEADAILKYAQRFEKGTTREQMGKAGGSYLEQIDAILDRYEFRRVPLSKIDRRQSLDQWIRDQEAQGMEPSIDARLLNESRLVNYRQASIDELRAVRDAVKNIEHLARYKNKLVTKQKEIAFADAIAELVASAENSGQRRMLPPDLAAMTLREKAADVVSRLDAPLLKMEQLVEWLDNGRVDGPWHTYLWNPIAQAQNEENDLHRDLTTKIIESLEQMPKEHRRSMLDTFQIPGIGRVTRKYIISMALNMGNDENMNKMLRGHNWTMETVQGALDKLSDADWRFVQATWDNINTLWPQIVELEKRMTGLAPKKVEARPYVVRRNGQEVMTIEGGYFPLVYDPRFSEQGQKQESGSLSQLFEDGYARATTSKGHTEARNEGFAAPLNLDFEQVLTAHMANVVKDLTHREAIVAANKILNNPEIRKVLQETMNPAIERQMMPWLRSVVNDRNSGTQQGLADFSRFMMSLRANTVAAVMGFKATTAIMQVTGLSSALDKVDAKYLGIELGRWLLHPVQITNEVRALSGEMRNRSSNMDRDIRGQLRNMTGQNGLLTQAQRFAFHGIALADTMVTVPTWMAAYRKAMDQGKSQEVAILEGDAAVRLTQGAGGPKDLAAVTRNNELMKTLTMFYSYFSTLYNRMRNMGREVESIKDMPRFLSRALFVVIIPAFVGDLIVGRGPEDEEDYPEWLARKVLLYPLMSIPLLRDIASSVDSGFDYKFTPLASGLEKLSKLAKAGYKAVADEEEVEWDNFAVKAAETFGYLRGVPGTAQMSATGKYLWRVEEGEEEADNFAELLFYAAVGKRKESK
jgi:hypothetical protein